MYHRGTLTEFNTWHEAAKLAYGIPPDGIVGFVNGQPAPQNERTMAYVSAFKNPSGADDYIWPYESYPGSGMARLTQLDIDNLNWFTGI